MKGVLNMSENRCPSCRRELPVADGIFCPYCGAALSKEEKLSEQLRAVLDAAGKEADPVKKHRMLAEAREAFPELPAHRGRTAFSGAAARAGREESHL